MVLRRAAIVVTAAVAAAALALPVSGAAAADRTKVVAAFYPMAWVAEQVGGNRVAVTNLTPAGAEPHDLELNPDQLDGLLDADLAIVMGKDFQPAVEDATGQRDGVTLRVLDHLPTRTGDPHVWLDPVLMRKVVAQVQAGLTKADPGGRAVYARNARRLDAKLQALDTSYREGLSSCTRDEIVTAHEAFGYLARRYGLQQQGVAGLAPDSEPDPKRIAQLTDLVKRDGVTTVFTESLVSPRIAQTLAREAGVHTEVLNPLEGLTDKERARGDDYLSVMEANLAKLRAALGCS
ncbi:MAG: zinc ABC transporter substrate-binding protein [Acidimicrobiia bacterium]